MLCVVVTEDATTSCTFKPVLNHNTAQVDPKPWFQHPQAHPTSSHHQDGHCGSCFSSSVSPSTDTRRAGPRACFGVVTEGAAAPRAHRVAAACELPPEDVTAIKNAHLLPLIPAKPQAESSRRFCLSVCVSSSINIVSIDAGRHRRRGISEHRAWLSSRWKGSETSADSLHW